MSPDSDARRIVAEIFQDFRKMFPNPRLPESERTYLAALILDRLREALSWTEDDHK